MSRSLPVIQAGDHLAPPVFEKVAVIGLGLIGGSIALAAREVWPRALVIAVDTRDVLEQAMVRHAIDVAADDPIVAAEADLVVLAAPVRENISILASLADCITGTAVVTDVGSTKRDIVEAAGDLPARLTFVGGHPLAGAARGGLAHARPDLFRDRPWIFTPRGEAPGAAVERLYAFARGLGARPCTLEPVAHDRLLAYLSHLPQLTASALMAIVGNEAGVSGLGLAGRGLVDTTRLASSPPDVWRDITATNGDEIGRALDELIERLRALRADLPRGDSLTDTFGEAAHWRDVLTRDRS
ncbi:MAG: prephenate dehydrogenase/arogenate dehydrogenase family protein [Acidimicrobiia bacterium]|nr:prephenate dehydrogenase/arogenate dehydrogenase family protein [Acidimicrobiia bacterium]